MSQIDEEEDKDLNSSLVLDLLAPTQKYPSQSEFVDPTPSQMMVYSSARIESIIVAPAPSQSCVAFTRITRNSNKSAPTDLNSKTKTNGSKRGRLYKVRPALRICDQSFN